MAESIFDTALAANSRAAIGGNNPPPDTPEEIAAEHQARIAELVAACNAWIAQVGTITNRDDAERLEAYIVQLRDDRKGVDEVRKTTKRPYDEMAQRVQDAFAPILQAIDTCGILAKGLKVSWLGREEKRIAAAAAAAEQKRLQDEEDARQAAAAAASTVAQGLGNAVEATVEAQTTAARAEQSAAEATQAAAARPVVRDGLGGRASGFVTVWRAQITDYAEVAKYFTERQEPKLLELLQGLANREAKQFKQNLNIPGATPLQDRRV